MAKDEPSESEYWKARYESERERLTKLWVAYKALEAEGAVPAQSAKK